MANNNNKRGYKQFLQTGQIEDVSTDTLRRTRRKFEKAKNLQNSKNETKCDSDDLLSNNATDEEKQSESVAFADPECVQNCFNDDILNIHEAGTNEESIDLCDSDDLLSNNATDEEKQSGSVAFADPECVQNNFNDDILNIHEAGTNEESIDLNLQNSKNETKCDSDDLLSNNATDEEKQSGSVAFADPECVQNNFNDDILNIHEAGTNEESIDLV
ncbi:hypothetical protein TSAR_012815 [Trichomalopsis sarcophagae]|uniref:Uncharacterized protein n=1 Tax=Trichomalopsis sarcophagae TaxID=543379 RepID=A0A232F3S0_9HYME|nr:hypothetical protein TSAR_012815 [Trichomalopsis sarcophagae]